MSRLIEKIRTKAKLLQKAKLKTNPDYKLKSAYEALAKTAGYSNWREWKEVLDEHSLFDPKGAALWHVWYASYDEALQHLLKEPHLFLLPFQKHFFICDQNYIDQLGLSAEDADLLAIGHNWVEPKDQSAWKRILRRLKK